MTHFSPPVFIVSLISSQKKLVDAYTFNRLWANATIIIRCFFHAKEYLLVSATITLVDHFL